MNTTVNNQSNKSTNVSQDQIAKRSQVSSYTAALQRDVFPSRTQAIVLDVKEGLSLTNYTVAVGKIVKPENIIYSSRISNGRICIYLKSKEIVEKLTEKYEFIDVGENQDKVAIRPLISKQQRIIISNVAPPIPHHILVEKFESIGIKCAPITTLRAGISEKGYEHVLSSRRQTFIKKEDLTKLPEFFKIIFDDISYYVYPSVDILKCFECREEGHIRLHCPKLVNIVDQNKDSEVIDTRSSDDTSLTSEFFNSLNNSLVSSINENETAIADQFNSTIEISRNREEKNDMPPPQPVSKRPLSSPNSSNTEDLKKRPKLTKKVTIDEVAQQLAPIKCSIEENAARYPITFEKLIEFLTAVHGVSNAREIASKFTSDYTALKVMLKDVHDSSTNRNLQSRINRIIKRIHNSQNYGQTSDSEMSQAETST